MSGTERLKSSGKYSSKCTRQKRWNRIIQVHHFKARIINRLGCDVNFSNLQKLKRRKVALAKTTPLSEERKTIWAAYLSADFMSSEDSFDKGEEDEGMQFVIRPLLWRSDKVNSFLSSLHHKTAKCQSKEAGICPLRELSAFHLIVLNHLTFQTGQLNHDHVSRTLSVLLLLSHPHDSIFFLLIFV